jgi:hypothetical protein
MPRPLSKKRRVETLLRVARHIRRWPHLFDFGSGRIPKRGCKACVLARAGVLLGLKGQTEGEAGRLEEVAIMLGQRGEDAEYDFYCTVRDVDQAAGNQRDDDVWCYPARVAAALERMAASL